MSDDTPRRKLIKTQQQKENDLPSDSTNPSMTSINKGELSPLTEQTHKISIFDDDLTEQCFRSNTDEPRTSVDMMEIDESNLVKEKSTRRRSRFRFSLSNNRHLSQGDDSKPKSRLCRTHSTSIINNENENQTNSSRRRKSFSTTGIANEFKHNEQITNLDKVFHFKFKIKMLFMNI